MISYSNIDKAINFYKQNGFKEIEVPWVVSNEVSNITLPASAISVKSDYGNLVGSAEQSFLSLVINDKLCGKFQATTPCFRNELEDELHKKYFLKTELFINDIVNENQLEETINTCSKFFSQYLNIIVVQTGQLQFDILDKKHKIELGSYGIREHEKVGKWIYATGCAEPRLSKVLEKQMEYYK